MNPIWKDSSIFLIILIIVGFCAYFIISTNPKQIDDSTDIPYQQSKYSNEDEWFSNMPLTFNAEDCKDIFEGNMYQAIINAHEFITNTTQGLITFQETKNYAEITYYCKIGQGSRDNSAVTAAEAEGGIYNDNYTGPATITIYSTFICLQERPTLLIHEIGHVLGLNHNVKPSYTWDIMHPFVRDNCDANFLDKDIRYLMENYRG